MEMNVNSFPSGSLSSEDTPEGGKLLGVVRPIWIKVAESECRINWFRKMIGKGLIVRDLEAFASTTRDKLRSEEMKIKEEERGILRDLMLLKYKDEKRYLDKIRKDKDSIRSWIMMKIGKSRKSANLMRKLRTEVTARKVELHAKFEEKVDHLEKIRKNERMLKLNEIPNEIDSKIG